MKKSFFILFFLFITAYIQAGDIGELPFSLGLEFNNHPHAPSIQNDTSSDGLPELFTALNINTTERTIPDVLNCLKKLMRLLRLHR